MTTEYNIEFLFPIPVIMFKYDYDKDDLIEKLYKYKETVDEDGVYRSNRGGWHSNYRIHEDPLFLSFSDALNNKVGEALENCTTRNGRIIMQQAWFNINPPGAFNMKHTHPECEMSGVLWIKVPEKSGNLIIENPQSHSQSTVISLLNKPLFEEKQIHKALEYQSIEHKVILFPSNMLHWVEINESNEDRISFAFNLTIQHS
jgi:uncharacterized protein (TIGR02466 family)